MRDTCRMMGSVYCINQLAHQLNQAMTKYLQVNYLPTYIHTYIHTHLPPLFPYLPTYLPPYLQSQRADDDEDDDGWRAVEACLWAIRSIAPEVAQTEDRAVPQIMQVGR